MLESGQKEERILLYNHPALQIFEQQKKEAAEADLKNLKMIVDERQTSVATEYFCIFEDDATEWLEVPDDNEKLQQYKQARNSVTGPAPAAEVITDLAEWVQLDLVEDNS